MATLILSAVGTAIGGPLGGALGAMVGNQLDQAIAGSPNREGPRLKELAVTTSSYGTAIGRHYGRIRAPGTVIWSTDLIETKEKGGSSKGSPSMTAYAYSISFAVALASRPIQELGRIWADGNILRGEKGDLKVGGSLRMYQGHGDQDRDPLIAADIGPSCPAFRGLAYCVFEDLQLADFGNRIPSLTFEIIADDGDVSLAQMTANLIRPVVVTRLLPELIGFTEESGPLTSTLSVLDQLYPINCDGNLEAISFSSSDDVPANLDNVPQLPEPVVDAHGDSFGELSGTLARKESDQDKIPGGLRYYDLERDYQAGLQRAEGRAISGRMRTVEFPGVLRAEKARQHCNAIVQRASRSSEQLMWRIAEIDPTIVPGQVVTVPGRSGYWRISNWEWRSSGVELDLHRLPPYLAKRSATDTGTVSAPRDVIASPTILHAFELPWDGTGSENDRQVFAAASSSSDGWTGAALYAEVDGALTYLQPARRDRSAIGSTLTPLPPSQALIIDRHSSVELQLAASDLTISGSTVRDLADGRNRVLVGGEVIQFANAILLGSGAWRLSGLLRGRGGTEPASLKGHAIGETVVVLDDSPILLALSDVALVSTESIAAIGLADQAPVVAPIANSGLTRKPLAPVHPRLTVGSDGAWRLSWVRRARGAWAWLEVDETSVNEGVETYLVGVGDTAIPLFQWKTSKPELNVDASMVASMKAKSFGRAVWVKNIGPYGSSDPVLLCHVS